MMATGVNNKASSMPTKFGGVGRANAPLNILSLNLNGIRLLRKVKALGTFLAGLRPQPDLCIPVETHICEDELDEIIFDTYRRAHADLPGWPCCIWLRVLPRPAISTYNSAA